MIEKKGVSLVLQSKSAEKNRHRDCGGDGVNDCFVYFSAVFIKNYLLTRIISGAGRK